MHYRKHINKSFFKKWSPDMAYVLGYIFADGSITKSKSRNNSLYWQITSIDKQIIQDIAQAVKWKGKVSTYIRTKEQGYFANYIQYRISVGSYEMVEDLISLGITYRKSLTLSPPNNIPNNMIRHFIRGFWDGDGSIFNSKSRGLIYLGTSVGCGSKPFTEWLAKHIEPIIKHQPVITAHKSRKFYSFSLVGQKAYVFCQWIYKDTSLFLKRKHNVFQSFDEKGRKHARPLIKRDSKITFVCPVCEVSFRLFPSDIKNATPCCSKSCAEKYKFLSGKSNVPSKHIRKRDKKTGRYI